MTAPLRIGLIGASAEGSWGALAHVPALRAVPGVELAAVATTRPATAEASARKFAVPLWFGDPFAMIADPRIDAVAVAVRVPAHKPLVDAAIAAGKAVYCEWPLGVDTAQAQDMVAAAGSAGVVHMVGLQSRQSPVLRAMRDAIAAGELGTVHSAVLTHSVPWHYANDPTRRYLHDRGTGAHFLSIPGGHSFDALRFVLGEFGAITAVLSRAGEDLVPGFTSDDQAVITARLHSGGLSTVRLAGGPGVGTGIRLEVNGTKGDFVAIGDPGGRGIQMTGLRLFRSEGLAALREIAVPESEFIIGETRLGAPVVQVARSYAAFATAIAGGVAPAPGFGEAVDLHRLLDTVAAAAQQRSEDHHESPFG